MNENGNALVDVLLPFYHDSKTLSDAIESIVTQSFAKWRLILVDNNADAISNTIAMRWASRDNRITVISENRQGIAHALNTGLANSTALIIARMDADDISSPHRLGEQYDLLTKNPEIGLVACKCSIESSVEKSEGYAEFVQWQNNIVTPEDHFTNRFIESPVAHPGVMFRRDLVNQFGGYNTGSIPEDYELWLRWMEHGVRFIKTDKQLLTWKDHSTRLSRTHSNYSRKAFFETKMSYLFRWLRQNIPADKNIIICGTGKLARVRAELLSDNGITIHGFTDVVPRGTSPGRFITIETIGNNRNHFYINFISKRGVRNSIRELFIERGLTEMKDFVLAA